MTEWIGLSKLSYDSKTLHERNLDRNRQHACNLYLVLGRGTIKTNEMKCSEVHNISSAFWLVLH